MIENEPRTWPQSSRSIPDNQNIGVAFMSPLVMPLLSRPCNPVNYRAGTGAPCKQQEKNRRPVKGENLQRAFVIYLDGLTKSESRRPPNRHITGATTGVFSASTKRRKSGHRNPSRRAPQVGHARLRMRCALLRMRSGAGDKPLFSGNWWLVLGFVWRKCSTQYRALSGSFGQNGICCGRIRKYNL